MPKKEIRRTPNAYTIEKDLKQPIEAIGRFGLHLKKPLPMNNYHWHGHIEFNWLLSGKMIYLLDGVEVEFPKNQLIFFNASVPHKTLSVEGEDGKEALLYNLYFPLDHFLKWSNIEKLQQNILNGSIVIANGDRSLDLALLKCWYNDSQSQDAYRQKLVYEELKNRIKRISVEGWQYLKKPHDDKSERQKVSYKEVQHAVNIMQYVADNLHRQITNTQVAREVGLHPNYAMNLFRKVMDVPLKQYIRRMRLFRAHALMMDTRLPASTIAFNAGFGSVSRFYEVFKEEYSMSPNAYRKKLKESQA